jgi:calcineurin-like phosphoesterase family protein
MENGGLECMSKFYSSDLHIDHKRIIELCKRPFSSLQEMQTVLVNNWNSKVSESDDVYILGDFSFGASVFAEYAQKLNGIKHFIRGNHDDEAYKKATNMNLSKCFYHGDIHKVKDSGYSLVLCHYPMYEWEGYYKGAIHLHGHCHGNIGRNFKDKAYDVGVDLWDFTPVTLEEILK